MSKLQKLDIVIGEALEQIMAAASIIKECEDLDNKSNLRLIGDTTVKLWDIRDNIYSLEPKLKPDFVEESAKNIDGYEKQAELHRIAAEKEAEGNNQAALGYYQQLLDSSTIRHFKTLAEAGLYRVGKES